MKLSEKGAHWLKTELVIVLAVVLLLGALFGYSLAMSRYYSQIEQPGIEQPVPDEFGVGSEDELVSSQAPSWWDNFMSLFR